MTTEDSLGSSAPSESVASKTENPPDSLSSQRVFKKTSPNSKLTMYLSSRDLVVSAGRIDRLTGVLLVDPEFVQDRKVYGQVTLTFRYGREDEEVMGLKFCNEAIMCLAQLYPPHPAAQPPEGNTPLQDALLKRLGPNAYPFSMEITPLAPPSVQLVPAKEYNGAPIGTSYDVRAYIADRADEKLHRRGTVRMGIRVVQRAFAPPPPSLYNVPGAAGGVSGIGGVGQQHHRLALFGCRSVPVDHKFRPVSGGVTDLADEKGDGKRVDIELQPLRRGSSHGILESTEAEKGSIERNAVPESNHEEERQVSCHVSFKEQVVTSVVDLPENNDEDLKATDALIDDRPGDQAADGSDKQRENEKETQIAEQFRSLCGGKRPSLAAYLAGVPPPQAAVEKPFLLSDGKVYLAASLDKAIYSHGEEIHVSVHVRNQSNKTVRRIKVFIVQHVDVCMFSNGKFKNVVAMINSKDDCPISPATTLDKTFTLLPIKSSTKNWIALEDSYTKAGSSLASTVTCTASTPEDRNVFAIYVSYYVKVKLFVTLMGGEVSLKLPFTLMHTCSDFDHTESLTRVKKPEHKLSEPRGDGKCEPEGT